MALTEALAHLHGHGLVHRDVKPSNIIFVAGRPKLADIGLVTDTCDAKSIVGTEGYLPPEGPGTPQADIFALGKVLYESLTGLDRRRFPELPTAMRGWSDRHLAFEINSVLLGACAAKTAERYPSAEAMLADLRLLAAGGCSIRRRHRLRRAWRKAAPLTLAIAGASTVILLLTLLPDRPLPQPRRTEAGSLVESFAQSGTRSEEAFHAYQAGRFAWSTGHREGFGMALEHFGLAVRLDPGFARAHAGLADCYITLPYVSGDELEWMPKAQAAAAQALSLDDSLPEAHAALGAYLMHFEWKWTEAEHAFRRALTLNPDYTTAHRRCALLYAAQGRFGLAEAEMLDARRRGPFSLSLEADLGRIYYYAGRLNQAIDLLEQTTQLETNFGPANFCLARALMQRGNVDEAIARYLRWQQRTTRDAQSVELLSQAYATRGVTGFLRQRLELERNWASPDGLEIMAYYHARLGEYREALECLEKASDYRLVNLVFLNVEPAFVPLRDHPQFLALVRRIGLSVRAP